MKSRKGIFYCSAVAASFLMLQSAVAQTPPPETGQQGGTAAEDGQGATPPANDGKTRKKPPRGRPPEPAGGGMVSIPPPADQQSDESILDEIDDYGPAGDLAPSYPQFDQLTIEFNKAVADCDLKKFLEVRERYIKEIRRILDNPNLEKRARAHFERVLNAVLETMVPIRAPLPCPVRIR